MDPIKKLERLAAEWAKRPEYIAQARAAGHTWEQIAEALGMSRAGVINLHNSLQGSSSSM